ncbi:metabotropic glycine receptor-like isoform X2 [Artemia franciscana]
MLSTELLSFEDTSSGGRSNRIRHKKSRLKKSAERRSVEDLSSFVLKTRLGNKNQRPKVTVINEANSIFTTLHEIKKTTPTQEFFHSKGSPNVISLFEGNSELYDEIIDEWQADEIYKNDEQEVKPDRDIVTKFLRIVESQQMIGGNCTAGTDVNLGEGVVDRYAQEKFRREADVAVNHANFLTRLWKYDADVVLSSEYLLHAKVFAMVEMDEDIFGAGNCYDKHQYNDYLLFCPFAYRLPEGPILAKDLAVEYKYLTNTSEWFYIARKTGERLIKNMTSITRGYNTYTYNESSHTKRVEDEILSVTYEDGKWSKPYFDCGGGNIWMMTYTVPFFGYANGTYFFKGTSGIDIDLRRVDIDQCPLPPGSTQLNIFAASDKCKKKTTKCVPVSGLGFRRGSYRCDCREGFYFPDVTSSLKYFNGSSIEEEYEKKLMGETTVYDNEGQFECLPCPEGCETCIDDRPCVLTLHWMMRTTILLLQVVVIACLPFVAALTWKFGHVKVVRAASPLLLRIIIVGAFFIYLTVPAIYTRPNIITCSLRVWFREIGFALAYGALLLKTWRISVIFRVRSAKAVKITDMDLIKRLGIIVAIFATFLSIRTLVEPPVVIVARTADDLKAYLCSTDWWDHAFTVMEMVLLVWGIRLCIVVRKAPSEFNESKFISMAIYNEFLLTIFLNVAMLFLQSPANPDLLYIIVFSHTQLTITLLLVLIFGSKFYMVWKGHGRSSDHLNSKAVGAKFLSKLSGGKGSRQPSAPSFYTPSSIQPSSIKADNEEMDAMGEFRHLCERLERLKERLQKENEKDTIGIVDIMLSMTQKNTTSSNPTLYQSKDRGPRPSEGTLALLRGGFQINSVISRIGDVLNENKLEPNGKTSPILEVTKKNLSANCNDLSPDSGASDSLVCHNSNSPNSSPVYEQNAMTLLSDDNAGKRESGKTNCIQSLIEEETL